MLKKTGMWMRRENQTRRIKWNKTAETTKSLTDLIINLDRYNMYVSKEHYTVYYVFFFVINKRYQKLFIYTYKKIIIILKHFVFILPNKKKQKEKNLVNDWEMEKKIEKLLKINNKKI